jgi:hypothetical protein
MWMVQQQFDQFLAGVARRADDGNFLRFHFQNLTTNHTNHTNISSSSFSFSSSIFQFSITRARTRTTTMFQTKNPAGWNQRGLENFQRD